MCLGREVHLTGNAVMKVWHVLNPPVCCLSKMGECVLNHSFAIYDKESHRKQMIHCTVIVYQNEQHRKPWKWKECLLTYQKTRTALWMPKGVYNIRQTGPGLRFKHWAMIIYPLWLLACFLGCVSSVSRNAQNNVKNRMCKERFPEDWLVVATSFLKESFAVEESCNLFCLLV